MTIVDHFVALTQQRHADAMSKIEDPDWRAAVDFVYRQGMSVATLNVLAYRIIKLERELAELKAGRTEETAKANHDDKPQAVTSATTKAA